jgi:acetolactate synthase-1/2/3 large subunit
MPNIKETASSTLVNSLKKHDVTTVFGLPGLQLDNIFDALYKQKDSISVIHTRHEQAATYMAFGYAQASGKVGTSLVVPGAGILNTMAALSTAYACNSPVLALTGQIPSALIGSGLGILHEIPNQLTALASVTKWQGHIATTEQVEPVMEEAFHQLQTGRKRPVVVEIPMDIAAQPATSRMPVGSALRKTEGLDEDAISSAVELLAKAVNPAIFVGGGIWGAEESLLALAELLQAPVFVTAHALGAIDSRHPLAQNMQVANDVWATIDVALAIGTRFLQPVLDWGCDASVKIIRVDIDPAQARLPKTSDVTIAGGAQEATSAILASLTQKIAPRPSRHEFWIEHKAQSAKRYGDLLPPQRDYSHAIRHAVPDDAIFCFDVTQLHFYSWFGFPAYRPRSVIQPGYQGTLGYGYPTALGAKVAMPDRPVIYIGGDGGFMFNCQELSTAMHFGINVIAIIFNDGAFGNVRRIQKEQFSARYISSDLHNPDFVRLAESFGMAAMRTGSPAGLAKCIQEALARNEPTLIEVEVVAMPNPHPYLFKRRVRPS